jgi:hypothetical protein
MNHAKGPTECARNLSGRPRLGMVRCATLPAQPAGLILAVRTEPRSPQNLPEPLILIDLPADPAIKSDKDAQPRCHE